MNIAFLLLSVTSLLIMTITSPDAVFPTMIDGAVGAIELAVKLLAIYAVWLSVLKMMEATGTDKLIAKLLKPLTKRLFKGESEEAYTAISINFASNLLGMGGAATPAGIKAMNLMHKGGEVASDNMVLLAVIASTSIQLIPATVIALRSTAGSRNASDIFLPTLIATLVSTAIGIILCKVFAKSNVKQNKTEDKSLVSSNSNVKRTTNKASKSSAVINRISSKHKIVANGKSANKTRAASKTETANHNVAIKNNQLGTTNKGQ